MSKRPKVPGIPQAPVPGAGNAIKVEAIDLSEQELETLAQYQRPVTEFMRAVRAAQAAQITFIQYLVNCSDVEVPDGTVWDIDWENRKLVSKRRVQRPAAVPPNKKEPDNEAAS